MIKTLFGAAAAAIIGLVALPAGAAPLPSYATGGDEQIRGTVASIDGKYDISVRDARGYIDRVSLHDGTIINPTGLQLAPGQSVTILGRTAGRTFAANEIDTPYATIAAVPVFAYGYPYYGYARPFYGYGRPYYGGSVYGVGLHFGRGFGFRG